MNQQYGCLRCMNTLAIIRIKMIVQSIGMIFSLREVKKSVVSVILPPSRDFLDLKHALKIVHTP